MLSSAAVGLPACGMGSGSEEGAATEDAVSVAKTWAERLAKHYEGARDAGKELETQGSLASLGRGDAEVERLLSRAHARAARALEAALEQLEGVLNGEMEFAQNVAKLPRDVKDAELRELRDKTRALSELVEGELNLQMSKLANGSVQEKRAAQTAFQTAAERLKTEAGGLASIVRAWGCSNGMCAIPAGTFQMGSTNGESDEEPVHAVTLAAFELDEFEVTVSQYAACVTAGGCTAAGGGSVSSYCNAGVSGRDNHPINCVDWHQATAYCGWAGKRLPTEEEWEYAARGTDGREYPWGNAAPGNQLCWKGGGTNRLGTCPVGSYPSGKSPFGVQDMSGNAWEWVSSLYASDYSLQPTGTTYRGLRGGGWVNNAASSVRSANRNNDASSYQSSSLGFRCAR